MMVGTYYFGRPITKESTAMCRSFRVIIRKAKANYTSNFSLWNCDWSLEKVREEFKKILIDDKDKYLEVDYRLIEEWVKKNGMSHYIIIQQMNNNTYGNSVSFGVELHDFDIDEIKNVLVDIFCNRRQPE